MTGLRDHDCTGCEACVNACPNNCLRMEQDQEGFFYPQVDNERCTLCQKCASVCKKEVSSRRNTDRTVLAGHSNDKDLRRRSSSGGVFSELAKSTLRCNGIVYGAAFDSDLNVRHYRVDSEGELWRLRGSKYVQSRMGDVFKKTREDLDNEKEVLFSGTPCQINGLIRYLGKEYENLLMCSVICHGVPSPYVFERYVKYQQGRIGSRLKTVEFRNKDLEGWASYYIRYNYDDYEEYFGHDEDLYFKGFLENLFLRRSCYECDGEWKAKEADIILGDFWGISDRNYLLDTYDGVNAVIINSDKGKNAIERISPNCCFYEAEYDDVLSANPALECPASVNAAREGFFTTLFDTKDIYSAIKDNLRWAPTKENRYIQLYPVVIGYFTNVLENKSIKDYLHSKKKKRIVLYANTDLMDCCYKDLRRFSDLKVYLSDLNHENLARKYNSETVLDNGTVVEMYHNAKIDCIIVCSISHENMIIRDFLSKGIKPFDIVSIVEIIFSGV